VTFQKLGKAIVRPMWLGTVVLLTAKDGFELVVMALSALQRVLF
jgi:hypothetical protein